MLTKALTRLCKNEEVTEKAYKKSKMYQINQDNLDVFTAEEMNELLEKIKTKENDLKEIKKEVKSLTKTNLKLKNEPLNSEVDALLEQAIKERTEKENRIKSITSSGAEPVSKEEKELLVEELKFFSGVWKERKETVMDLVDQFGESTGKKNKDIFELFDIEVDEDYDISLRDMKNYISNL